LYSCCTIFSPCACGRLYRRSVLKIKSPASRGSREFFLLTSLKECGPCLLPFGDSFLTWFQTTLSPDGPRGPKAAIRAPVWLARRLSGGCAKRFLSLPFTHLESGNCGFGSELKVAMIVFNVRFVRLLPGTAPLARALIRSPFSFSRLRTTFP